MRTTYTKPNSHSQKSAAASLISTATICMLLEITKDEWVALFFECGCAYAESVCRTPEEAWEVLTNKKGTYWAEWLAEYVKDDAVLFGGEFPPRDYTEYKRLKETYI